MNALSFIKESYQFLKNGGPVMVPILLCSVIALIIVFERILFLRKKKGNAAGLLKDLEKPIQQNKIDKAIEICGNKKSSIARIAEAVLKNFNTEKETIERAVDEEIIHEIPKLERYVGLLGIVANISPLLGLLGTVTGMIKAFFVVSQVSLGDPTKLAGGISEALITTAAGLVVGIPSIAAYNYLLLKIDGINWDMEQISKRLTNYILSKNSRTVPEKNNNEQNQ